MKGQTRLSGPVFLKGEDIAIPPSFQLQREKKSNCKAHRDCEKKNVLLPVEGYVIDWRTMEEKSGRLYTCVVPSHNTTTTSGLRKPNPYPKKTA